MDRWLDFDLVHGALPDSALDQAARRELEVLALMAEPRRPALRQQGGAAEAQRRRRDMGHQEPQDAARQLTRWAAR